MKKAILQLLLGMGLAGAAATASATSITLHQGAGSDVTTDGVDNHVYYDTSGFPVAAAAAWATLQANLYADTAINTVIIEDGTYNFTSTTAVTTANSIINKSVTVRGTTNSATDNVQLNFSSACVAPMITVGQAAAGTVNHALTMNFIKATYTAGASNTSMIRSDQETTGNGKQTSVTLNGCTLTVGGTGNSEVVGWVRQNGDDGITGTAATQYALTVSGGTYTYGGSAATRAFFNAVTPGGARSCSHARFNLQNATFIANNGGGLFLPSRGGDDVGVSITGCTFKLSSNGGSASNALTWNANTNVRFITNSTVTFTDNKVYVAGTNSILSNGSTGGVSINATYGNTASAAAANNTVTIERNYVDTKTGPAATGSTGVFLQFGYAGTTPGTGSNFTEATVKIANNVLISSGGNNTGAAVGTAAASDTSLNASAIRLAGGIKADIYHNTLVHDNGTKINPTFRGFAGILLNLPVSARYAEGTNVNDNLIYNYGGRVTLTNTATVNTTQVNGDGVVGYTVMVTALTTTITDEITPVTCANNLVVGPITSAKLANRISYVDSATAGLPAVGVDAAHFTERSIALGTFTGAGDGIIALSNTATASITASAMLAPTAKLGTYTIRCVTAASNAGTFVITDPDNLTIGTVNASASGTFFFNQIPIWIRDGAVTDFAVNDFVTVDVNAVVNSVYDDFDYASDWKPLAASASQGAIDAAGFSLADSFSGSVVGTATGGFDVLGAAARTTGNFDVGAYEISTTVPVEVSTFVIE